MTLPALDTERIGLFLMWTSIALAAAMAVAVVVERTLAALEQARERRLERGYQPLVERALAGDEAAGRDGPGDHRLMVEVAPVEVPGEVPVVGFLG